MVQESSPRIEGDIIGFSDDTSDCDESIDIADVKSNVKFLPATVEGRRRRVYEHRNELVFLLYELVRQEGKYTQLNVLTESLGTGNEEEEDGEVSAKEEEEFAQQDETEDEDELREERVKKLI